MRHLALALVVSLLALSACKKPRPPVDRTSNVVTAVPTDDGDRSGGVAEDAPVDAEEAGDEGQ